MDKKPNNMDKKPGPPEKHPDHTVGGILKNLLIIGIGCGGLSIMAALFFWFTIIVLTTARGIIYGP